MHNPVIGSQSWFAPSPPPAAALSPHAASVVVGRRSAFGLHVPAFGRRFGLRPQHSSLWPKTQLSAFGLHASSSLRPETESEKSDRWMLDRSLSATCNGVGFVCVIVGGLLLGDSESYRAEIFTACRTGASYSCINISYGSDKRCARGNEKSDCKKL